MVTAELRCEPIMLDQRNDMTLRGSESDSVKDGKVPFNCFMT